MTSRSVLGLLPLLPRGQGLPEGREETLSTLAQAVEHGDPDAQFRLGKVFLASEDPLTAMMLFRAAHSQGHEPASVQIDAMCGREDGKPGNDEDIANWYMPIAEEGNPTAQVTLAMIYEHGRGVEQSTEQAARWLRRAADQRQYASDAEIAIVLEYWLGVEQDPDESAKWLRLAAEHGWSFAQSVLATNYLHGQGVEQDADEVERLMLVCCSKRDVSSMASLASLYAIGRGLGQDQQKAVKWYRRVFAKADADELFGFGYDLASRRDASEGDIVLAHTWFQLAASKGHDVAREACVRSEPLIPADRLHASRMIARKCIRSRRRTTRSRRRRSRRR